MDQVHDVIRECIFGSLESGNYDIQRINLQDSKIVFRLLVANMTNIALPVKVDAAKKATQRDALYLWENRIEEWTQDMRDAAKSGEIIFENDDSYTNPPCLEFPGMWYRYRIQMHSPKFPEHVQMCRFPMRLLADCIDINVEARQFYRKMMESRVMKGIGA